MLRLQDQDQGSGAARVQVRAISLINFSHGTGTLIFGTAVGQGCRRGEANVVNDYYLNFVIGAVFCERP